MSTPSLEIQLVQLRALQERAAGEVSDAEIKKHLASKHSVVVAKVAAMAAEGKRAGLVPELVEAFERFMVNGEKADRGCTAKLAVVNALCALDCRDFSIYQRGVKYVQKEASFGPSVDTAAELRGRCAVALAECRAPHAVWDVVELLVDPEGQARGGAARAMGVFGSEDAGAVLRLKLLTGDEEPVVLAECCQSLLHMGMEDHREHVVGFLAGDADAAEDFVMGLMESRDPGMLEVVKLLYEGTGEAKVRKAIVTTLAVMRVDGALEFLLGVMGTAMHAQAKEALEAMRVRRGDERMRGRILAVVEKRGDAVLKRLFESYFG